MDLAASAGLILDHHQVDALDAGLGETDEATWAASQVTVIEPRQNGKDAILEARALGGLFLFREELCLWTAHEFKAAREGFLRVQALVDNWDHLRKRVKAVRVAAGEEGVELLNGSRLRFVARSGGSGRSFSADCLFLNEAYALTDDQLAALLPTMSAKPNHQVWFMSTAPPPSAVVLRRICRAGRAGASDRLAYIEYSAAPGSAVDDRVGWAEANPGFPARISEDTILDELAAMDPAAFQRERLGIVDLDDEVERAIDVDRWGGLVAADAQRPGLPVFAVDFTPDRSAAAVGVAGRRTDGLTQVQVIDHRVGTAWAEARLLDLWDTWRAPVAIDPGGPAGSLVKPLEDAGVELVKASMRDVAQACGGLYDAVMGDPPSLRHYADPGLDAAIRGAGTRPFGDAWVWSRKHSDVDISPLYAVTLAAWALDASAEYDALESVH